MIAKKLLMVLLHNFSTYAKKIQRFSNYRQVALFSIIKLGRPLYFTIEKPNTKARQTVYFTLKKNRSHLNEQLGAKKISFFVNFLFFC
jgi:hypothetical protein